MIKLLKSQIFVFLSGTLFAYYTVFEDFKRFYAYEGTLFKIKDCIVPNPVTTACFYGSFAFLTGLIISIVILKNKEIVEKVKKLQKYLLWLTEFAFVFAWSNFGLVFYRFVKSPNSFVGCAGVKTTSLFTNACFIGSSIFTIALILVFYINKSLNKK